MKKVLIIGSSGILGKLVCAEVLSIMKSEAQLIVADYHIERGKQLAQSLGNQTDFCYVDLTNRASIETAIHYVDVVIVALKQEEPTVQKLCIEKQVHCIDVNPFSSFSKQVELFHNQALEKEVSSVIMSGFYPGLSALLVKKAVEHFDEVINVDVALLQNTNAKAGITGMVDMLRIISKPVTKDGQLTYPGFTKHKKLPFGRQQTLKTVREIHHDEKEYVARKLGVTSMHYWTGWNSNRFNHILSVLKNTGLLKLIVTMENPKRLTRFVNHNESKGEEAFLTVEVTGRILGEQKKKAWVLSTPSDYQLTAMVTAALVKAVGSHHAGVVFPFELTDVDMVLTLIDSPKISLLEW
ncbi:saccharopine dehydrogenase NADP-binding domain-containing protein [Alkalihalobacillus hemicellulosilyticus]|uniref:Saccharopine dehydrogenase NADP binding domain-containing protein n=1 Tax=Halalkalibacter hemicellulosilyticusJCM 9152 TaxID=1236971 RepID=W4QKC7_9BACI|nr:saccharopine dehydrogenase NADP-binding domain-containing protein [Halalkalibacter hemicellulosilyticus]GAE32531.1 hypothetical protein JCM9152_4068 [Halalkalibacter hemicellulosilyticusJCM 9152]